MAWPEIVTEEIEVDGFELFFGGRTAWQIAYEIEGKGKNPG